jgi:hypothetical protein
MKLAIIGSRGAGEPEYTLLCKAIRQHYSTIGFDEIISGGAKGADSLAARYAKTAGVKLTEFLPDWDKHGKAAGFIRNEDIIKSADQVLAIWDGLSRGTGNSLSIAKRLKKPTVIVYF